jgi:hypothetical protein
MCGWNNEQWYFLVVAGDKSTSNHERLLKCVVKLLWVSWTDKLIYGNYRITTDELCFTLFIDKGGIMAITEEPCCSKVYSLGPMKAERCTQRQGEQQPLIFAPIWQWCLRLPVADCHVGQNLGPPLWTWTKIQWTEWCHMTSPKQKFKRVPYAGKTVSLSGWGVILVILLPRETTLISNCYIDTLGSLNDSFCQVHPSRKMPEVLLLHDNARLHTTLCTTEAFINFEWTVCCIHSIVLTLHHQNINCLIL